MTDNIRHKYRAGNLSPDELRRLRAELSAADDAELSALLEAEWQAECGSERGYSYDPHVATLYSNLEHRLFGRRAAAPLPSQEEPPTAGETPHRRATLGRRLLRVVQMAAAVLLPVALIALGYLYRENRSMASDVIVVSTGNGEQASVTLPDGSRVAINQNSRLTYMPSRFRGSERRVSMDGEGYYCVARDESRPFYVDADGLAVRVLGTKFNLKARDKEPTAELVLTEGSVAFTSLKLSQSRTLKPGQKVTLDKLTGRMDVVSIGDDDTELAWCRKEMVFRNTPLSMVFAQLRKQFHKEIVVDRRVDQRGLFTGTLSSVNLNDNLEIIDLSCELRSRIIGKTVFVELRRDAK